MSAPGLPPTIAGLRRALAEGSLGVDEALHAQRAHLEGEGARYRCVAHVFDAAGRRPDGTRPLAGVGLAHKDVFDTADRLPACGRQHAPPGRPPMGAAAVLRSLEGAGGAHLAALAMVEDACGATGEARPEAQPVNPLDPALAVGGSSSGSAVAVAAGLCYASLGTDTAGSVRIPAASCGVLGLKTTHGAISTRGVRPLAPSLDTVGILARSAADAAAALAPLGGDRHRGLRRAAARWGGIESYLLQQPERRLVVARASELGPDVAAALDAFAASVAPDRREVSLRVIDEATSCAEVLLDVEAAHGHWKRLREEPRELSAPLRAVVGPGAAIPALWYREALARRAPYLDRVRAEWFGAGDLVLLPALPNPIPEWRLVHSRSPSFDARQVLALSRWMAFVNYLGLPSVVFPVGRDARGHPVSVQVVGRPHSECALLAFAYRVERERHGTEGFTEARAGPGGPTRRAGEA